MSRQTPPPAPLDERIVELETKVAFQDQTLHQLGEALARQQADLTRLAEQVRHLAERLKEVTPSAVASESEETPPPHY